MRITYDVLKEPWIPVADQRGEAQCYGILDVLAKAHELKEITDASPLVEYGLYRLLCVFLMDALRPEESFDIEDLLAEGRFDMEQIEAYVSRCQAEGASFDLFDEKRPFLQTPYVPKWDREEKSVKNLDCRIPSGNNHTHFDHLQIETVFSYAEAARYLPVCALFITAGAQGYPSSINSAPPFFTLIKGENLFETLVNTMIPLDRITDFDSTPVFWCCEDVVEPKKKVSRTSWLYGMLFPARRVLLVPDADGVRKIYLSQGMNFCAPDNWTDPHVTYRFGKEGRFPWRPNGAKAIWRNLNDLIDVSGKHAPQIVEEYAEIHGGSVNQANVCLYGVQTSQASYLDLFYHNLQIPMGLLRDGRALLVGQYITEAEELAKRIGSSMSFPGIAVEAEKEAVQEVYQKCELKLWDLCGRDLSAEEIDGEAVVRAWKRELYQMGREVRDSTLAKVSLTGKQWITAYQKQEQLNRYLLKLKKEGEMTNDGKH